MNRIRTKTESIKLPIGTTPAGYPVRADFGKEFVNCLGYYAVVLQNGGLVPEACKVTLSNSAETIVDKVTLGHYLIEKTIPIKDRFFKEEPFATPGGYCNVQLDIPAVTTSALEVQFVFLVSQD